MNTKNKNHDSHIQILNPLFFDDLLNYKSNAGKDWLIANGFLSRGGSVLIQGEPGAGKSKFTQHLAFSLALGMEFLGLKPAGACRVLYIQAEDTVDDLHESALGFKQQSQLDAGEIKLLRKNLMVVSLLGMSGDRFVTKLKEWVESFQADIVITDPLMAFAGCDMTNQAAMTDILREGIGAYLREKRCGWICVHHIAKGSSKFGGSGKMTRGLGTVEIAAFFRGIIDLEVRKSDRETLIMEIAKRSRQANLRASDGTRISSQVIRMGSDSVSWIVDGSAPAVGKSSRPAGRPNKVKKDDVEAYVAEMQGKRATTGEIIAGISSKFKYSTKQAGRILKKLTPTADDITV